jgi:predicted nucleic acid-binding protein
VDRARKAAAIIAGEARESAAARPLRHGRVALSLILVTANTNKFMRVPGLMLEDWRK